MEPALADGRYRPYFLEMHGREAFYLKATVCGQGDRNAGELRATTNEIDAVEKIRSALREEQVHMHSHLWLEAEGDLDRTLSKSAVAKPFIDFLKRTSADEVERSIGTGLPLEEVFTCGSWTLRGRLDPNPSEGAVGQVWGPARSAMGDASDAIAASLASKAKKWRRYGPGRDGILVIALSVCHSHYFWNDGDECARSRGIRWTKRPTHPGETISAASAACCSSTTCPWATNCKPGQGWSGIPTETCPSPSHSLQRSRGWRTSQDFSRGYRMPGEPVRHDWMRR